MATTASAKGFKKYLPCFGQSSGNMNLCITARAPSSRTCTTTTGSTTRANYNVESGRQSVSRKTGPRKCGSSASAASGIFTNFTSTTTSPCSDTFYPDNLNAVWFYPPGIICSSRGEPLEVYDWPN
jgi:hypothetical protein